MNVGIRYSAFNKALTEYFIHNAKNSLSSSENILDQLASFRMETGLPAALRQDKKYQKAQKKCNKANVFPVPVGAVNVKMPLFFSAASPHSLKI